MIAVALGFASVAAVDIAVGQAKPDAMTPAGRIEAALVLRRFDANGDGKISKAEWQELAAASARLKDEPGTSESVFAYSDTDGDGTLSSQEFAAFYADVLRQRAQAAPNVQPPAAPAPAEPRRSPLFRRPRGAGGDAAGGNAADVARLTPEQTDFFEKRIRPVLVESCYSCHSVEANKSKGGLLLDTRAGIRKGGDKGPAVVPGKPDDSLLLTAIHWKQEDFQMPPKNQLSASVIADFEKWVAMGAPDPRDGTAVVRSDIDIAKGKQFWAFQLPKKSAAPAVKDASWPRSDVDRFLLAAMEGRGVKPVADADRATLLRRLTYDLTGLPPTPAEVEAFLADSSATAVEAVVDRLLASHAFGERWGRHWLDVARYGESSGKQVNITYPHAWRYRDYVIDSFNADKPFDQFVKEQLAGDLMPSRDAKQKAERQIATGYLALGSKNHNERSRLQFELDLVDEQIDAFSQGMLGLTLACARCHDHKFDPIPQADYYAVAGVFRSTETLFGTARVVQNNHATPLLELPAGVGLSEGKRPLTAEERKRAEDELASLRAEREEIFKAGREAAAGNVRIVFIVSRTAQIQSVLDAHHADGSPKLLAMGVRDRFRGIDSPLYTRGETEQPGPVIPRGLPQVLVDGSGRISTRGSGRLELAEWVASSQNPLTARVWVNRVWLHLFGQGIVTSPDNFGASGALPSNQPLLDTLAVSFMEGGWSTKSLVRQLVLTRAYQLSTSHHSLNHEVDPDNALNWRATTRRLEAESIRDSMLTVAGKLDSTRPAGSPIARVGDGQAQVVLRFMGQIDNELTNRSVYLPIVRDQLPEVLATFDFAEPSMVVGQRATTSVPSQSLYLLNSPFVINAADAAASKIAREQADEKQRIRQAYLSVYGRVPTASETAAAEKFLNDYVATISSAAAVSPAARRDAWTALIQSLLGSSEFLFLN